MWRSRHAKKQPRVWSPTTPSCTTAAPGLETPVGNSQPIFLLAGAVRSLKKPDGRLIKLLVRGAGSTRPSAAAIASHLLHLLSEGVSLSYHSARPPQLSSPGYHPSDPRWASAARSVAPHRFGWGYFHPMRRRQPAAVLYVAGVEHRNAGRTMTAQPSCGFSRRQGRLASHLPDHRHSVRFGFLRSYAGSSWDKLLPMITPAYHRVRKPVLRMPRPVAPVQAICRKSADPFGGPPAQCSIPRSAGSQAGQLLSGLANQEERRP